MNSDSGISHNIQPREQIMYYVNEGELESLGSHSHVSTLLSSIGGVLAAIAATTALDVSWPPPIAGCVLVFGCTAGAIVFCVWSYREASRKNKVLTQIKRQPKPK